MNIELPISEFGLIYEGISRKDFAATLPFSLNILVFPKIPVCLSSYLLNMVLLFAANKNGTLVDSFFCFKSIVSYFLSLNKF